MTSEKLFRAMRDIDVQLILDAAPDLPRKKTISWQKAVTIAACFCIIVIGAIGYYNVVLRGASAPGPEEYIYGKVSADNIEHSTQYMTLEELCLHANEVVTAEYTGGVIENGKCMLAFTVKERHNGGGTETSLRLSYRPSEDEVHDGFIDAPFDIGRSYILLLEKKQPTVYDKTDLYSFVSSRLVIPCDNVLEATLGGESLKKHMAGFDMDEPIEAQFLIDYMLNCSRDVPDVETSAITYIPSNDPVEIISASDYVLKVKIGNSKYDAGDRITHTCQVETEYKSASGISTDIDVLFPKDAVAIGDTVIIIVNKFPSTEKSFFLTSDYGIIDISQEDTILDLINSKGE